MTDTPSAIVSQSSDGLWDWYEQSICGRRSEGGYITALEAARAAHKALGEGTRVEIAEDFL